MTARPPSAPGRDADRETLWQPREASVAQSVAQYSRFVSIMKLALPIAAGVLLLLILVRPLLRQEDDGISVGGIKESDANLSMTNARYYGTDDKGQPYSVTAAGVKQRGGDDRNIDLNEPKAEISLTNGTWMSATATGGVYNREKQVLELSGDVALFQHQGNEIHTTEAQVQLKDGTASGKGAVHGNGPMGDIEAKGFSYSSADKSLRFHGPARLTLKPKSKSDEAVPAQETKP
jgi:lipopolysaccharide export system protein LptC